MKNIDSVESTRNSICKMILCYKGMLFILYKTCNRPYSSSLRNNTYMHVETVLSRVHASCCKVFKTSGNEIVQYTRTCDKTV